MSDRSRRLPRLALLALVGLLAASGAQAQSGYRPGRGEDYAPPPRGRQGPPPARPFTDPDRAANAARNATGGRVLGVQQGGNPDNQNGYRVRILQPDGRVRSLHVDPNSGAVRD